MTSLIIARRNSKLAAFRDAMEEFLGLDLIDVISAHVMSIVNSLTVRVQPEPLLGDHSLVVSSAATGNIHVNLFKAADSLLGTRPRYLWSRLLPVGQGSSLVYTTGHGFWIHVIRLEGAGTVSVFAQCSEGAGLFDGGADVLPCFQGEIFNVVSARQVDVFDGFYLMLDRVYV